MNNKDKDLFVNPLADPKPEGPSFADKVVSGVKSIVPKIAKKREELKQAHLKFATKLDREVLLGEGVSERELDRRPLKPPPPPKPPAKVRKTTKRAAEKVLNTPDTITCPICNTKQYPVIDPVTFMAKCVQCSSLLAVEQLESTCPQCGTTDCMSTEEINKLTRGSVPGDLFFKSCKVRRQLKHIREIRSSSGKTIRISSSGKPPPR